MKNNIELDKLIGLQARAWEFTCSHDKFVVRVQNGASGSGVEGYLIFMFCESLKFPVMWKIKFPNIQTVDGFFVFEDLGVSIHCQEIMWQLEYP